MAGVGSARIWHPGRSRNRFKNRISTAIQLPSLITLILLSTCAQADWQSVPLQSPAAAVLAEANARPEKPVNGVIRYLVDIHLRIDEDGLVTHRRREVKRLVGRSAIEAEGAMTVPWSGWHEGRPALDARVITRSGRALRLRPEVITEGGGGRTDAVMFSDRKHLSAPLPGVGPGSVVETMWTITEHRARMAGGTWQMLSLPAGTAEVQITVEHPPKLPISVQLLDLPDARPTDINGIWHLKLGPIPPRDPKSSEPYAPRLALTTWPSWAAVATAWHTVSGAHFSTEPSPEVARLIDGLPQGGDAHAAAAAVAARIHRDVRYTGVELGEAAYVPRSPSETLIRTYGDCKDLTVLAGAALSALGHRVHPALIRSGRGLDLEANAPGMAAFNHVILRVEAPTPVWIDMTARYLPVGQLPIGVADRRALLIDATKGRLVHTPAPAAAHNTLTVERAYTLTGIGPGQLNVSVQADGHFGALLRRVGDEPDGLDRLLTRTAYDHEGTEDFTVTTPPSPAAGVDARYEVTYRDVPSAWADQWSAQVTVRARPLLTRLPRDLLTDTDGPLTFDHPQRTTVTYTVPTPTGFTLDPLKKGTTKGTLGAGTWSREIRTTATATQVVWQIDTGATEWTAKQRAAARKTIIGWLNTPVLIEFSHKAEALFADNKGREALTYLRTLTGLHPEDYAQQLRYISALTERGYGFWARSLAEKLLTQKPDDAHVATAVGWTLLHGDLGRILGPGSDRVQARARFDAALKTVPRHALARYGRALTLLYGDNGALHGKGADLEAAVEALQSLRDLVPSERFAVAQVGALTALGRHEPALAVAKAYPKNQTMKVYLVYGVALSKDGDAAVKFATTHVPAESTRADVLIAAAKRLIGRRAYASAKVVLAAAKAIPQGEAPAKVQLKRVAHLAARETLKYDKDDPRTPVRRVLMALFDPDLSAEEVLKANGTRPLVRHLLPKVREMRTRAALSLSDPGAVESREIMLDAIAGMPLTLEKGGDQFRGYAIRLGEDEDGEENSKEDYDPAMRAFVIQAKGKLRLVGLSTTPGLLALEIIRQIGKGRLKVARRWLDWLAPTKPMWIAFDPFLIPAPLVGWTRHNHAGEDNAMTAAALWLARGDEIDQRDAAALLSDSVARNRTGHVQRAAATAALIQIALDRNTPQAALDRIEPALMQYHTSSTLLRWRIAALHQSGRLDRAHESARWGLSRPAFRFGHALFHLYLADLANDVGDLEKVETHTRAAAQQRYSNLTAVHRALWTAAAANRVDDIINKIANRLRKRDRLGFESRAALAAVEAARGEHRSALTQVRIRANLQDEVDATTWYLLGRMLEFDQEPEGARQAYQKAIEAHEATAKREAAEAAEAEKASKTAATTPITAEGPPVATAPITLARARLKILDAPAEDMPVF